MDQSLIAKSFGNDRSLPSYEGEAYKRWKDEREMMEDFYGGTRTMWLKIMRYLPQHPGEFVEDYYNRVRQTELFPGVVTTVNGLNGIQWRTMPRFASESEGQEAHVDQQLLDLAEDIDGKGNKWTVFAPRLSAWGWLHGFCGILIDYPVTIQKGQQVVRNREQERLANIRPYWVGYSANDILQITTTQEGARSVTTRLILRDRVVEPYGKFGERTYYYYRIFRRLRGKAITVETYRCIPGEKPEPFEGQMTVRGQTEIPFVTIPHGHVVGAAECSLPLLDLCYTNLAHFRVQSDRRYSLKMTLVPILCLINFASKQKLTVGSNLALSLPEGADAKYVEPTGKALGEARQELQDLIATMTAEGMQILSPETRAAETAKAKGIDREEKVSRISIVAAAWQDALAQAWKITAAYLGPDVSPPNVKCETDFSDVAVDPATIKLVQDAVANGDLSQETLWDIMKRAKILGPDFDPVQEAQRLSSRLLSGLSSGGTVNAELPGAQQTGATPKVGVPIPPTQPISPAAGA